jgi:hypothetical protein
VNWPTVFLGIIALATLVMALLQVGAIVVAARLARRLQRLSDQLERDVQPMIGRLTAVTGDAARVAALAASQAERIDALLTDVTAQVEEGVAQIRQAVVTPAREGLAVLSGVRAAVAALRGLDLRRSAARSDDEDALFIG